MDILISPFFGNSNYLPEILELDAGIFGNEFRWSPDNFIIKKPLKEQLSFIALIDDKVAGYLIGSSFNRGKDIIAAHVHRIATGKAFKGRGIGTKLMYHFEKGARQNGISVAMLETDSHFPADEFYFRLGYREVTNLLLEEYLSAKSKLEQIRLYTDGDRKVYFKNLK